jgi:hypothetical protein
MEEAEEEEVPLLELWEPEEPLQPDRETMEETVQVQDIPRLAAAEPEQLEASLPETLGEMAEPV